MSQLALSNRGVNELSRVMSVAGYSLGGWVEYGLAKSIGYVEKTGENAGKLFVPKRTNVLIADGWGIVVFDPRTLYHFGLNKLTSQRTLDIMKSYVGREIKAFDFSAGVPEGWRFGNGLTYIVKLSPTRMATRMTMPKLPAKVSLNLDRRDGNGKCLVPIGVSTSGEVWKPLGTKKGSIGHSFIVGTTGSGKSTWLQNTLAALLSKNTPERVRVALIDLKRSELAFWENVPHVWGKKAHSVEEAIPLLQDVITEMNRRGDLFSAVKRTNLEDYHQRVAERLPFLIVVIDECVGLVDDKKTKALLEAIVARGRAYGVFVWAASQDAAATNGFPRMVKLNLGTKIVFRVEDAKAAEVAGCEGAELLKDSGRMIAKIDGEKIEAQGYFLSNDELDEISQSISSHSSPAESLEPKLTELLRWAKVENGGFLSLKNIADKTGAGQQECKRIAKALEDEEYLAKDSHAGNRRRVTPKGLLVIAESEKPTNRQSQQTPVNRSKIIEFPRQTD